MMHVFFSSFEFLLFDQSNGDCSECFVSHSHFCQDCQCYADVQCKFKKRKPRFNPKSLKIEKKKS